MHRHRYIPIYFFSCSKEIPLFDPDGLLLVHVGEHEADVGGEKVVHLVAEAGLAEKLGAADEVADGHVEVSVAAGPVGDPCEGVGHQHLLQN